MELFDFNKAKFIFDTPLYTKSLIPEGKYRELHNFITNVGKVDGYSPTLKENSTFEVRYQAMRAITTGGSDELYRGRLAGVWTLLVRCLRTNEEYAVFVYFDDLQSTFQKIGQYPSIADLHISKIKQYDKILGKEKLKEFTKAIGLAANGVGIGSFVYLRRIFEGLLEEAHQKASGAAGWDVNQYSQARVNEKILLLKEFLPPFLVENRTLYGILSKGIHSLSEEECLEYFDIVKTGIEFILDEKQEAYEKERKINEAKMKISKITKELK